MKDMLINLIPFILLIICVVILINVGKNIAFIVSLIVVVAAFCIVYIRHKMR